MLLRRLGAEPLSDAGAIDQIETGGFDLDDAVAVDVDARTARDVTRVEEAKAGLVLSALAAAVREEPKSKVVAIDGGALAIAVKYPPTLQQGRPRRSAPRPELCAELAGSDGAAPQAIQALLKNEALLSNFSRCRGAARPRFLASGRGPPPT